MLRRYSSRGVDTISIDSRRTIGHHNCDINIEGEGVSSPHVAIELHPFTRTYWLRELSLTGTTTVNGRHVNGQMELHSGDLIRLGNAQPLVFEEGSIFPIRKISTGMKSTSTNKSYDLHNAILPVLGHRLEPQQSAYRTLNDSRGSSAQRAPRPKRAVPAFREKRLNATAVTPNSLDSRSSPGSIDSNSEISPRLAVNRNGLTDSVSSVGNSLLQRVVRLQSEVSRKDEEILTLLHRLRSFEEQLPKVAKNGYSSSKKNSPTISPLNFELEAYRAFIHVIGRKLHRFNEIVLSRPQKDYADILLKFSRSMEEPFGAKMLDIEDDCRKELHQKGFDELQLSRLRPFLSDEHKEHISSLGQELEIIFPVIQDATATARESISVCAVFTQWSLHLGKGLREYGLKSSLIHHAIDCLKDQFNYSEMSKHWLPPAVAPIFRLIALELEKRESKRDGDSQTPALPAEEMLEELIRVKKEIPIEISQEGSGDNLDNLIIKAEQQTIKLQNEISTLSDTIKEQMSMDKTTEQHLEELCMVLHSIGETLQNFTDQNDQKRHKTSIISVDVKQEDLEERLQQMLDEKEHHRDQEPNVPEKRGDNPTRHNSPRTSGVDLKTENSIGTEGLESLRERLFAQLRAEPSPPSDVQVLVRKDLLTDLIYAALEFSNKLESPKGEHSFETEDDAEEIMQKVTVGGTEAVPENRGDSKMSSLKESPALSNIEEESHEEFNYPEEHEDQQEREAEEEVEKVKRGVSFEDEDEVFGQHEQDEESPLEPPAAKEEGSEESASRRTSYTSLGVISSEEYVNLNKEENESSRLPSQAERRASRLSKRSSRASIIEPEIKEFLPEEEEPKQKAAESAQEASMGIPLIAKQSPSPVESQISGMTLNPRPKSARPRSSADPTKMPNGQVILGDGNILMKSSSLAMEAIPVASDVPGEVTSGQTELKEEGDDKKEGEDGDEKEEWSSQGTVEEVSLSGTGGVEVASPTTDSSTPVIQEVLTEEERQLMEARKRATQGLADSILNSPKPKSICDYQHSAHIQSHINTASRQPAVYSKVPVQTFDFFNCSPQQKKKVKIAEEKPPLRQPRMQFKL